VLQESNQPRALQLAMSTPLELLSTKDAQQSTEGYTHYGRLFDRGARDQELDGNRKTRHKIYTGLGRQDDVKPYVLCSIGLY
jgi:hypothetical protein